MSSPRGWTHAALGSLGLWRGGGTPSKHVAEYWQEHGLPWVSPKDMKVFRVLDSEDHISERAVVESATQRIRPDSVLLVIRSGILEHTLPVAVTDAEVAINQDMKALTPREGVSTDFVAWAIRAFARAILSSCKKDGTTVSSLDFPALQRFCIPIAPAAEQLRIVDAIESFLSRLDAAVASLERAQAKLKAYRASVLKAAVEGRLVPTEAEHARKEGRSYEPADVLLERILKERRRRWENAELARMEAAGRMAKDDRWKAKYEQPITPGASDLPRLPEGWSWATVDQLGEVTGGITKNAAKDTGPKRYPYLRVANVYANRLVLDDVKEIAVDDHELPRLLLQRGDLLVVEGNGSVDQIGRVALWDGSIERAVHQNHLIKVRFRRSQLESWALTWLLSPGGRAAIERVASSTSGLHTLSISKVQRLPVPLPPESEQARLLETVDQLLSIVDATAESIATGLRRCARLRQSVLCWAFEGKLVDQASADEPADALLSRIRAERSASATARPKPKRARKLKVAS